MFFDIGWEVTIPAIESKFSSKLFVCGYGVACPLWGALAVLCWFAFQCAVTVGATVLPVQGGRFVRPSPRSPYTYTASGASSAQLASPCFGPLGCGPDRDRAWHPRELGQGDACSSLASGKSSPPPARFIHHSRHDASSAGYRLLASFAPGVASREPESRRSPALAPRKRRLDPTFRCGAFFVVASALADILSTRLTSAFREISP